MLMDDGSILPGVSKIENRFLLAGLVVFCLFAGLVSAAGPAFNTTVGTGSLYGCTITWDTVFGNSTSTVMQTNYTVWYKLSTDTSYVDGCSSAVEASGVKTCILGSLFRSKLYNFNITACNSTVCNTTASTCNTLGYSNVNSSESLGVSVNTGLQGGFQFIGHSIDSALSTSAGLTDMVVIFFVVMLAVVLVVYAAKIKKVK